MRYMSKLGVLFLSVSLILTGCGESNTVNESISEGQNIPVQEETENQQTENQQAESKEQAAVKEETDKEQETKADAGRLKGYMNLVSNYNMEGFANPEVVDEPMRKAQELIDSGTATQEEYDMALQELKDAFASLHDGSGFPSPELLRQNETYPDAFTFFDGTEVNPSQDWDTRADEIKRMYEYYMYGVDRDGEGEELTSTHTENSATLTISREGRSGSFSFHVSVPDETKVDKPANGWPVIIAMGWFFQVEYANSRGYAVITYDYTAVASDDATRRGAFYDVYPYGKDWTEQTGALAAWGWGASKIIDSLEQGLGEVYQIDPTNTILTGVSRCGKATAIAGVYDPRIRIAVPTCSGAGGMAMFRYTSEGETYDLSSIGASAEYTFGQNEPLSSLKSGAEGHWFNDNFKKITTVDTLPFDQHLLASLYAKEDQYLFIISSYIYEDWTNPPAMWETYKEAKKIFDTLGYGEHLAFQIHKEGHAVIDEDVVLFLDYADKYLYGKDVELDYSKLNTCLFETE